MGHVISVVCLQLGEVEQRLSQLEALVGGEEMAVVSRMYHSIRVILLLLKDKIE